MLPFWGGEYANPSSLHQFGQAARHAVECGRSQVAELIGAQPKEIVFTSGGTESINLAIRGILEGQRTALTPPASRPAGLSQGERGKARGRFVTTAVEHSAVLRVAERTEVPV